MSIGLIASIDWNESFWVLGNILTSSVIKLIFYVVLIGQIAIIELILLRIRFFFNVFNVVVSSSMNII